MRPISIRFRDDIHLRLKRYALDKRKPLSAAAQLAVDEWLRMQEVPGVVFRDGPTGRRPALPNGPDIWEVASVLAQQVGTPEERLSAAAESLGLPVSQVETAARYWTAYRDEIDQRIAANAEAADRELAAWEERRSLLGA